MHGMRTASVLTPLRSIAGRDLLGALTADAAGLGLLGSRPERAPVTAADIDGLPEPVGRYLRFMNVVGRPRDASFRLRQTGRFRMRPGQRFMPFEAWQLN